MNSTLKISIALCTYNGVKYLPDQLSSYLKQERLPDELIICDDGSSDGTIDMIRQYAAHAPFSVQLHINKDNLGSTKNFEKAFQLCAGEIIVPSDQDDVWHKSKLRRLETTFREYSQVGLIFTDANVVGEDLNALGYRLWQSVKFTSQEQSKVYRGDILPVLMKHNIVTGATMAFRAHYRSFFTPIPKLWVHDAWITFILAMITDVLPLPEPLIEYRQHTQNQVGTPGTTLLAEIDYALAQSNHQQAQIYEKYQVLEERIESQFPERKDVLHQVREQINHRRIRSLMPENRLRRVPIIIRELLTGRYHSYSFGYSSATKDFLV
jgi:glycosyltransferase involved in cell wall biosynthesis